MSDQLQEVGIMPEAMFVRYAASPAAREAMDEEVREYFEIPVDRYFTVTMPPGAAGNVFIDLSKTRAIGSVKLSKAP
ncbi:MAG: hypothetical protein EOP84_06760 [Verrucomicrobiaceae bacterium]|nr:MAG: hypothetical protein EOP84_06760 [Verrucomicrobiaceae bacterium]